VRLTDSLAHLENHKIKMPTEIPSDSPKPSRLEDRHYIRQKLYSGQNSALQRYAELVVGRMNIWRLLKYELLTCLFGPLPGALGLFIRKLCYRWLFGRIGRGVVFGRSVVIRNPDRIVLGDRVVIDDYVVLDGRGGDGDAGLHIGDEVIINRGALIQAKVGTIRIGSHCDIGAETMIISQGANVIEDMVSVGGGSKIGGGIIQIQQGTTTQSGGDPNDFATRGQVRVSKGTVRIGTKSVLGENVTVLDGAEIGSECIVGACTVIRGKIPDQSVVALQERLVILPRATFGEQMSRAVEPPQHAKKESRPAHTGSPNGSDSAAGSRVVALVLRAVAELNQMLPDGSRLREDTSCALVQPRGPLDSLGVINLLVAVEDQLEAEFGRRPNLTEMGIAPEDPSPLSTIGSLAKFVAERLKR
jgi:acetyltransferase-like isoleucine patch superfamily enzyme/acyl carrier protein